jgi:hypothetical protein
MACELSPFWSRLSTNYQIGRFRCERRSQKGPRFRSASRLTGERHWASSSPPWRVATHGRRCTMRFPLSSGVGITETPPESRLRAPDKGRVGKGGRYLRTKFDHRETELNATGHKGKHTRLRVRSASLPTAGGAPLSRPACRQCSSDGEPGQKSSNGAPGGRVGEGDVSWFALQSIAGVMRWRRIPL